MTSDETKKLVIIGYYSKIFYTHYNTNAKSIYF